ncbi:MULTISPECIES: LCP family protein [unclassified Actinobaculum]|uniref:LCP family protein n=1 Tax=unclassified Actinobaculum TaxID=2609299 RepID=UPI000D52653F|nr:MULTISPECIES: LCP family protein [unclassified Actinobaculum]AWE41937.1 hypothetical protein DDD63_03275 [Actinobaculum sp. 313]RTE50146.1 hypothetical protein EKN07_02685 [Actinobaculum sp. 352]
MSKSGRAAAHLKKTVSLRHRGRVVALAFFAALLTVGSTVGIGYSVLQGNIKKDNPEELIGTERPNAENTEAMNILVLGSDVRSGASDIDGAGASGAVDGMRADTTMIVHISADRSRVDIVSIPRDTLVDIPSCSVRNEPGSPETFDTDEQYDAMFNSAFAIGGQTGDVGSAAACTMKTVEALTGIRLTGYIVVDFGSFQEIVEALGGVPMYFEEDMYDSLAGLDVKAGCRLLNGQQALALARARKEIGDGSDISRISRQQDLVGAMVREVLDMNLLTDLPKLYQVMEAGTASLSTSDNLGNITTLASLANSLRNINLDSINFITMPWEWAGSRVTVGEGADQIWEALANDTPVTVTVNEEGKVVDPDAANNPDTAGDETDGDTTEDVDTSTPTTTIPASVPSADAPSTSTTTPTCNKENAVG